MRLPVVLAVAAGLILGAAAFATPARAMCAYNRTNVEIAQFWLKCGWDCWNQWDYVEAGGHRCRPSKSGKLTVKITTRSEDPTCSVEVDKHGWVSVTGKNMGAMDQYTVTSKHSDGSVRSTCYIYID